MRIDRLLGITIYLMNRGRVTCRELANRFEVSERTIQRDMDAINMAGIPLISLKGVQGGYELMDTFNLQKNVMTPEDHRNIMTALKGLCGAFGDRDFESTMEKVRLNNEEFQQEEKTILDFGILREDHKVNDLINIIEEAIDKRHILNFSYCNGEGKISQKSVEPIVLMYKWYSWYMMAYHKTREDYLMFKIVRMENVEISSEEFSREHGSVQSIIDRKEQKDGRAYYNLKLRCKGKVKSPVLEYIKGNVIKEFEDGDFLMETKLPKGERMWLSLIIGFGGDVKVLEPSEVRDVILEKARRIIENYE